MRFSGVSANAVWNNAVRTITGFGTSIVNNSNVNQTIAATSTVQFVVTATQTTFNTFAATANAGGTILIQYTDGTNTWTVTTIAISTTGGQDGSLGVSGTAWQIHNNSASAATWWSSGITFTK